MTSQTEKAKAKLFTLSASLDDLEAHLQPLFTQTLPESIVGLGPIQQAKLQTVLPYLVYDLVFIYLKSRGIDPKTHPVVPELDRVRQYFEKITAAEKGPAPKPTKVDKAAANRFIKNAITQVTYGTAPSDTLEPPSSSSTIVPVKITEKMLQRQRYDNELKERDAEESEEEVLVVFNDDVGMDVDTVPSSKGKEKADAEEPVFQAKSKHRRAPIDPFAGYGDDLPLKSPADRSASKKSRPQTSSDPDGQLISAVADGKLLRGKKRGAENTDSPSGTPGPDGVLNSTSSHQSSPQPSSKTKKLKKKARKASMNTS